MEAIKTETRKWGNSLGIIIPKDIVEREHLKERDKIKFIIIKDSKKVLKETFGIAKGKIKRSAQEIKDELRKELYE